MKIVFGQTYDTRNKKFEMDDDMYKILDTYLTFGNKFNFDEAWQEGIAAGRIYEKE